MSSTLQNWEIALIALGTIFGSAVVATVVQHFRSSFRLHNKVVVITGGSSGIGKAVAKQCLKHGAHVALIARKAALLEQAQQELLPAKATASQRITIHSADVVDETSISKAMAAAAAAHGGAIDVLVASAGISSPRRFEETSLAEFNNVLSINVTGVRNAVYHALGAGQLGSTGSGGRVVLVSSQAGQAGLYGYTAYAASKFALNGFAQALAMELYTRDIRVSVCFPPDTDTPLLASENETKPKITKMLSESSAMVPADTVASCIVSGIEHHTPQIAVGFDGWMLSTLTAGMFPPSSAFQLLIEVLTLGLWRLIALFYVGSWFWIIGRNDDASVKAAAAPISAAAVTNAGSSSSRSGSAKGGAVPAVASEDAKNK